MEAHDSIGESTAHGNERHITYKWNVYNVYINQLQERTTLTRLHTKQEGDRESGGSMVLQRH